MSRSPSQDVRVAWRCGYGSTVLLISTRAFRSRSSLRTSRKLLLRTTNKDGRRVVSSDFRPDQSVEGGSSSTPGVSLEATESTKNKCPLHYYIAARP